uniref:phytol kinase n=1 Tax=Tetradesmus obliquus TaxID=3088 RepID=A0A383WEM8_TETOB|eukprot:jgi/Sobl393_1/12549/SZX75176.1
MQEAGLPQQLRAFAQAVAGRIPLSSACNNPGCVSLAQRSELLLVGGKRSVCSRCKAARYCCKACQVEHWKWHKKLCRGRSNPAAAGAAAGAAAATAANQQ